jgi:hypothetical protein
MGRPMAPCRRKRSTRIAGESWVADEWEADTARRLTEPPFLDGLGPRPFNSFVADVLEPASSGRAKCRGCGRTLAKGELRFGESLPNAYAEGEALYWFHVVCAACMRPEKFGAALDACEIAVEDREWLRRTADFGAIHRRLPRLVRVEQAPSGRAHCRQCRDLIEKDAFRIALQMFEEGRMSPIGSIHVGCAEAYFGTRDILDRVRRLTPELSDADLAEFERTLREAPPAAEAEIRLAKTRPPDEPEALPAASGERTNSKG